MGHFFNTSAYGLYCNKIFTNLPHTYLKVVGMPNIQKTEEQKKFVLA